MPPGLPVLARSSTRPWSQDVYQYTSGHAGGPALARETARGAPAWDETAWTLGQSDDEGLVRTLYPTPPSNPRRCDDTVSQVG